MEIKTISRKKVNTYTTQETEERLKKYRKEYDKPVKGMFEFIDAQGGWIEFNLRIFPGEAPMYLKFIHGEICEIPMGIVKHLNNTKKKIRRFSIDKEGGGTSGLPTRGVPSSYETISRIRFTPIDVL